MTSRRFARVAAATLVLSVATAALGQTTADKEQAKALVVEGRQLRDEKQDHKGALERFQAAYRLVKTPIIGLDLAREHAGLSELLEAYGICDEISRLPTKDTESAESKQARGSAATLGAELKARLPMLSIKLKGPHAAAPRVTVLLDDAELAPESLLVPRAVNPGKHTLVLRVEGAPPTSTAVTAAEGTTEEVALEVPSVVAKVEPTAAPRGPLLRTTGLVVSGTGVLALGVGGALALLAKSKADGASCNVNNVCATSADVEQRHAAVQQANVATVFVVVGAALGVGGAVLWLAAPSGKADAAKPGVTGVGVAPSGLVVGGQF